jgi:hypothetical protein
MSRRQLLFMRLALVFIALSTAPVAVLKGVQATRYLSPLVELPGTVATAALTDAIPMAHGNPRERDIIEPVPTRLTMELREFPGLRFQVALREDPALTPPVPAPGDNVTVILPARWREMEVGPRVLAMGLRRGTTVLVDPAGYPYAAEFRAVFVAVGAAIGAFIAALAAWRLGRYKAGPRSA